MIATLLAEADWLNPPPDWRLDAAGLWLRTGAETDFWQHSFYGFRRDSGHALLIPAPDEFTATLTFTGRFGSLYEQAGLLLRIDAGTWLKCGIEHSDGAPRLSTVVTRGGRSDWSVAPAAEGPCTLRLTRLADAVLVHARAPDGGWQHLRLADFPEGPARIGPMACSPTSAGLEAVFTDFALSAPIASPLH